MRPKPVHEVSATGDISCIGWDRGGELPPVEQGEEGHVATSDRSSTPHFGRWLALIMVCGLLLRFLVAFYSRIEFVNGDGFGYYIQAGKIAHGAFFVDPFSGRPEALHPPAWVGLLGGYFWAGGHTFFQQQLLACVIGSATVVLVGLATRRIAGDRAGLIAAGIAVVYAGLWLYERALLSETLLFPGIALMILAAYRFRGRPSALLAAALGAVCGLLVMTRSEQILLLPLLIVPLVLAARDVDWRRRLAWLGLAMASLLVVIAPWAIYNLTRFQQPVLLSTGSGNIAMGANCDATYYGPLTGWATLRCAANRGASSDPSVADSQGRRIALTYAEQHLGRVPVVLLAREGRAFELWSPFQQTALESQWRSNPWGLYKSAHTRSDLWAGRLALFSYWLLLLPAAAGALVLRRRTVPIYPLVAFVATIVITVAASSGDTRYRAGADVSIIILAAVAIDAVLARRRAARRSDTDREVEDSEGAAADPDGGVMASASSSRELAPAEHSSSSPANDPARST